MTGYPIPTAALDDRLAFIGTAGAGKTYTMLSAAERLLASKARAIIVDPLDVTWGLRLMADGETASPFEVVIFGGSHGDLPLNEHSGALVGETVAGMRESCIISLGGMVGKASERRFMLAFLTALYRHANGEPVHLIIDEADMFAPQRLMDKEGDAAKLLGQMETMVRRGRVKGLIPWLITQRPAVLSKDVLSQADGLIALKLTASQDRDAVGAWIEGQADRAQGREILASLPTMQRGQGVVWIPGRGILETVAFPTKATFDSSRTPKRGETIRGTVLKPLDLGKLKDRLASVEAEARANDPKALKTEIARLTKALAAKPSIVAGISEADREAARHEGWTAGVEEGERRGKIAGQAVMLARVHGAMDRLRVDEPETVQATGRAKEAHRAPTAPAQRPMVSPAPAREPSDGVAAVPAGCAKPLAALAGVYPAGMTEAQWATVAGYKRSGGTWGAYKSRLRGADLIEQKDGRWFATASGAEAAGDVETPPAPGPDLVRWWVSRLPGTSKVAEALIEAWPRDLSRDQLAEAVQMSAAGGSFGAYLSRLASPGLIERDGGVIRLSEDAMGPR